VVAGEYVGLFARDQRVLVDMCNDPNILPSRAKGLSGWYCERSS